MQTISSLGKPSFMVYKSKLFFCLFSMHNPCMQPTQILFCLSCTMQLISPAFVLYILNDKSAGLMHNNFSCMPAQINPFLSANKTGVKDDLTMLFKAAGK